MDKIYNHKNVEEKIYKMWEKSGYFKPEINPIGKPYCIVLPPPNANGALHFGHAMFVIEDILIRYHRMKGESALWLPGADHAGIETQFVFEKKLKDQGKSRMDYDRETLYKMIDKYVNEHRGGIENQLRSLGFSLDWSREKYTLDPDIVSSVTKTFKKMYDEGLVYRDHRLVNYCTFDGTSFSDLEAVSMEREGTLYHIKFPVKNGGFITIATTRPETMVGDVAVMVNSKDKRYKNMIGKTAVLPIVDREIPIIADEYVDMDFGTGAVKVTPSHDFNDYEIAKKHKLSFPPVIGMDGKMKNTKVVDGLYTKQARAKIVEVLKEKNLLEKEEKHKMVVRTCYKCKNVLEPLPLEQWFVKVETLKKKAIEAVKRSKIKIAPKRFEKIYFDWMKNLRDWNISRQIVWGIRIPAYRCESSELRAQSSELTRKWFVSIDSPENCQVCGKCDFEQDTDTFDTWFSSGQWPIVTLASDSSLGLRAQGSGLKKDASDFEKFYPTSVMETGYDLLKAWVSRMIMLGIYITGEVPFKDVLFHGLVNDPYGKKMSKSKGNVVNPLELVDQYGADAVRFALVYGNATGNDQALSYPKLDASRKFTNKLWNIARFIILCHSELVSESKIPVNEMPNPSADGRHDMKELLRLSNSKNDKDMVLKVENLAKEVTKDIEEYNFNYASEKLYDFIWHEFADIYIEEFKAQSSKLKNPDESSFQILYSIFMVLLKLLHPFMPFVTEEIYHRLNSSDGSIMISKWPT
jgi:valyl-tRNA synthetase